MAKAFSRRLHFAVMTTLFLGLAAASSGAFAQDANSANSLPPSVIRNLPPGVTAADAQRLLQSQNPASMQNAQGARLEQSTRQIYVSSAPGILQTTSALETLYNKRAGQKLTQFGYDLIGNGGTPFIVNGNGAQVPAADGVAVPNPQIGAVQDDYILGPGDQLNVTFRGDQNSAFQVYISRDGTVELPNMAPIPAAGRPFGEFRADVERSVQETYVRTRVFLTVTQVRQLSVRVVGEVSNAGTYQLNGLSTVLDALNLAGGIKKTGSLRNITLVRGTRTFKIDLYAFLQPSGATPDLTVGQGDRIVVPAVGQTVGVAGDVRRPGIYELPPGAATISAVALLFNLKGKLFSGSAGAYALSTLIGLAAIASYREGQSLNAELPVLWFWLPVMDCVRLMMARLSEGRSPFSADLDHVHHLLLRFFPAWLSLSVYLAFLAAPGVLAEFNEYWANAMLAACLIFYVGFIRWAHLAPRTGLAWNGQARLVTPVVKVRPADPR